MNQQRDQELSRIGCKFALERLEKCVRDFPQQAIDMSLDVSRASQMPEEERDLEMDRLRFWALESMREFGDAVKNIPRLVALIAELDEALGQETAPEETAPEETA
jgi:hypothetical protein